MSEFTTYKIGDLCSAIYSGGTPSTEHPEYWDGEYFWLSSGETANRYIYSTEKTITQEGIDNSSTRLAKSGNLVMACAGQGKTRGQVSVLKCDTYINQSIIALVTDTELLDPTFLFYNLTLRYIELRLRSDANSTRGSITTEMLKRLQISIPDLATQKKIADILSAYDDLIENNLARISLLEKMASELYKEWFVRFRFPGHEAAKFVNRIPDGWKVSKLSEIADFVYGKMPQQEHIKESGYPIFSGYRVVGYYDSFMFESPMLVLVARGVGGTGDVKISPPYSYITNLSIVFKLHNPKLHQMYLYHMFTLQNLRYLDTGAAQSQITIDNLKNVKVIIPNSDLLILFEELVNPIYAEINSLKECTKNLTKQRDLLLPRLMSGKLSVEPLLTETA